MQNKLFYVGQKAFINRDATLLILKTKQNELDFPGGQMQKGEKDIKISLQREVKEETSLEIEVLEPFTTWSLDVQSEIIKRKVYT